MAQSTRSVPANYPQPLGNSILKADAYRQASILRQEIVTDLLSVLGDARESPVRARLIRLIESHLKAGIAAAHKAEDLWPAVEEVKEIIGRNADVKPALAKKQLKLFAQWDRVQDRSLQLLEGSFENIRLILERLRPPEHSCPAPSSPSNEIPNRAPNEGGR